MKARQTQATSPKVSSPCQRCPEGKCRSRTSATLRRCSVASRTGMSSTRSIRCTWGQSLFIPSLLFPYSFWKTPSGVSRTGGREDELLLQLLVVVLHELADQRGRLVEHVGRNVVLGPQPPQP